MDAGQVDDVHAVDGGEVGRVIALKYLLGESYHLLNRQVEFAADSFEQRVHDVEVDHQHVSVDRTLRLQILVLPEECQQKVLQLLGHRLQVDLLLVQHCLVDLLFNVGLAVVELVGQLPNQRTDFLVLHELLKVLLAVPP